MLLKEVVWPQSWLMYFPPVLTLLFCFSVVKWIKEFKANKTVNFNVYQRNYPSISSVLDDQWPTGREDLSGRTWVPFLMRGSALRTGVGESRRHENTVHSKALLLSSLDPSFSMHEELLIHILRPWASVLRAWIVYYYLEQRCLWYDNYATVFLGMWKMMSTKDLSCCGVQSPSVWAKS